MTIEMLYEKLQSITGNSPIAKARRLAIMALIVQMSEGVG